MAALPRMSFKPARNHASHTDENSRKVLVIDDEEDVTILVGYHLRANGFTVEAINDPSLFMGRARTFQPELIILDVMMPEVSGIQICRMLRADPKLKRVPVVFLSAKAEEGDRVQGLEVGADDYICKPFSPKELVLKVQAIFRRAEASQEENRGVVLQIGKVVLDSDHHRVTVDGSGIELTATEFRLLKVLMERKGRVQARDHLLLNVWNYDAEIETRTVDTHVRRLREKLGDEASLIETVRGVGYRMTDRKPDACPT